MRKLYIITGVGILLLLFAVVSCRQDHPVSQAQLIQAELLLKEHPDRALTLLKDAVSVNELSEREYADWCLLMTEAQDRNHIEHTSDSLIRVALAYYENQDNPDRLMQVWFYMGRVSQDLQDAVQAQTYYLKALEVGERTSDFSFKALICNELGLLYIYQDASDMGLTYMKEGLVYLQQTGDTTMQSFVLRDIGRTYRQLNRLDSAEYYYRQALQYTFLGNRSSIQSELGSLLNDKGEYSEARYYLKASLDAVTQVEYCYPIYYILGKLYMNLEKTDSARYYLNKSLESSDIRTKAGAYYSLSLLARQHEDWPVYARMLDEYNVLHDSIRQQTYTETLQRIQSLYNYQQKETEARQYQLKHAITQRNLYLIGLVGIFLFACLVAYFFYTRRRKEQWEAQKRLLHLVIDTQQAESEEQIEVNQQHIEELDTKLADAIDTQKKLLDQKKLVLELKNNQIKQERRLRKLHEENLRNAPVYIKLHTHNGYKPTDGERLELMEAIDTAYPSLYPSLLRFYPAIEEWEKEVCYYTKIGLKNKQMSVTLSCHESTISVRKARLYRKIFQKKGTTEQFEEFIQSL